MLGTGVLVSTGSHCHQARASTHGRTIPSSVTAKAQIQPSKVEGIEHEVQLPLTFR